MLVKEGKYLIFKEVELHATDEDGVILHIEDKRIKDNYKFSGYVGECGEIPSSTNWNTENGSLTLKGSLNESSIVNIRLDEIDETDEEPKSSRTGFPFAGLFS